MLQSFSFYQTTATQEPSFINEQVAVEQAVSAGVEADIEKQAKLNKCGRSCGYLGGLEGVNVYASGTDILVTLEFGAQTSAGEVTAQVDIPENSINSAYISSEISYFIVSSSIGIDEEAYSVPLQLFEQYADSTPNPTLPMTQNQLYSVLDVVYAAQGLVGGLPDQFFRMFYFSAVSATTLGFGDIVPVTTESRLLVTSEALLGVVVVGLFLNSLARRSSDNKISPADELNRLVSLRDSGALTSEEFSQLKADIIAAQEKYS